MTWDDELAKIIRKRWRVGQTFKLEEIYKFEDHFSRTYPENNFIQEKLRQALQHLRDQKIVEFMSDRGTYKRIS